MSRRGYIRAAGTILALAGGVAVAAMPSNANAQTDVRMIRPNVMMLMDTSGSMEWSVSSQNASCIGADGGPCMRCPTNPVIGICDPGCPADQQKNRWTTALEVLTGTIQNFQCRAVSRNPYLHPDLDAYDRTYPIPHLEPMGWGLGQSTAVELWAPMRGTEGPRQLTDGVLDTYADRVRFGLMTFDNDYCFQIEPENGMYSYGEDRQFRPAGCNVAPISVNVGARRSNGPNGQPANGGLVSVGPPDATPTDLDVINEQVQSTLTGRPAGGAMGLPQRYGVRPFGGTPIAGMLHDALYYWNSHPDVQPLTAGGGDPYHRCRPRYNILITDGTPNMDLRPICEGGVVGSNTEGICPYPYPSQIAAELALPGAGRPAAKTFVIAFNATDPDAAAALEPIAMSGGTVQPYYATNRAQLQSALSTVLDQIASETSTRTAPAFASVATGGGNGMQFRFQSSFGVASGYPWEGVLERRRTRCNGTTPEDLAPVPEDDFGAMLQNSQRASRWGARKLWTVVPSGTGGALGAMRGTITSSQVPAAGAPALLNGGGLPLAIWNRQPSETPGSEAQWLAWLEGTGVAGSPAALRNNRPLGDIYHSNPAVIGPPGVSLPDQSFGSFRLRALSVGGWRTTNRVVGTRETTVYVGTNDGVLHAFNSETAEEIWGFVPPYLMSQIRTMYPNSHQFGVDGTPVVRDIRFVRTDGALGDQSQWRTVLVAGLRGGGGAYFALDVTDPYRPRFLWQFAHSSISEAYGTPAIATIFTRWRPGATLSSVAMERAVAILPGGTSQARTGDCANPAFLNPSWTGKPTYLTDGTITGYGNPSTSNRLRCWQGTTGQFLHVVDLETGIALGPTNGFGFGVASSSIATGSPLVGSPALHIGTEGAVSTRAYIGDADGRVWRLDMSNYDPRNWTFYPAFDLFYDQPTTGPNYRQPIISQPVLSIGTNGETLIAVGSGDPDLLEGSEPQRIAVYSEEATVGAGGVISGLRVGNIWDVRPETPTTRVPSNLQHFLYGGERLTGNMSLFNGVLYFGTFIPSDSADRCQSGFSRLWGVDLSQRDMTVPGTLRLPIARLDQDGDDTTTNDIYRSTEDIDGSGTVDAADRNAVLYGVGVVRRPLCVTTQTDPDPFNPMTNRQWINNVGGGDFQLIAQTGRGGSGTPGSRTNVMVRRLPPPQLTPQVRAWATVFE